MGFSWEEELMAMLAHQALKWQTHHPALLPAISCWSLCHYRIILYSHDSPTADWVPVDNGVVTELVCHWRVRGPSSSEKSCRHMQFERNIDIIYFWHFITELARYEVATCAPVTTWLSGVSTHVRLVRGEARTTWPWFLPSVITKTSLSSSHTWAVH
jgi:hypothetical protein